MRFSICLTLLLALLAGAPSAVGVARPPAPADVQGFDLLTPDAGWLLLDHRLVWTADGGATWRDITPAADGGWPMADGEWTVAVASFPGPAHGFAVLTRPGQDGRLELVLARTADGGGTWRLQPLDLFPPGDVAALAGAVWLQFLDDATGFLTVKQLTSANFSLGALFATVDGGDSWTRRSLPIGEPPHFTDARHGWVAGGPAGDEGYETADGGASWQAGALPPGSSPQGRGQGVEELDMASPQVGWALRRSGDCTPVCRQEARLLRTVDGGRTWWAMALPLPPAPLPGGDGGQPAPISGGQGQAIAHRLVAQVTGQGFDKCEAPALAHLQAWLDHSPYRAVNLYIGGVSRACSNDGLDAAYVAAAHAQGWWLIPTWVGPQPPCTAHSHRFSYDPAVAYAQGQAEAEAAAARAEELGLARPGLGTVVYYDLEAYNTNNGACRAATSAFIDGWSQRLQALGQVAGAYGAGCASAAGDWASLAHVPEALWAAHWIYPSYRPDASVWGVACLSDALWADHQRLRQYSGGHYETWGAVTLNIDCNVLDGYVADPDAEPGAPRSRLFLPHVARRQRQP